jgi:hypothetical protein
MTKPGQRAEVNTFIQGLITEASPLNFPPNASKQEENFELFRDGTRKRRLGIDYETGHAERFCPNFGTFPPTTPSFNTFIWEAVAGKVGQDFLVVQNGTSIDLYDLSKTPLSVSVTGGYLTTLDLVANNNTYSFASINGNLVIATGGLFTYQVVFNGFTPPFPQQSFELSSLTLKVRDFWGVDTNDDNLENDIYFRPASLSPLHSYNLENQSWGIPRKYQSGTMVDPIGQYFGEYSKYPSNSEVVWTALQFQAVTATTTPYERLYPNMYEEVFGLAPLASKGYFIIDVMSRGASRKTEYEKNWDRSGGLLPSPDFFLPEEDKTPGGPTVVCEYAGRMWYGGFSGEVVNGDSRSPTLNNYVLFSKLVINDNDVPKCYQEGDPTSREGADVVDTDGGYIKISGAHNIVSMVNIGNDLVILADNGIWAVSGGNDYGFSATNYRVIQLSSFGCCSVKSVVLQGESIMYWNEGGIYVISRDKVGQLAASSLTKTTIQSLFDSIPLASRREAAGTYDDLLKKAKWVYKTGTIFSSQSKTVELVFDLEIGNFSMNTIQSVPGFSVEAMVPFFYEGTTQYITYLKTGSTFNKYTFSLYKDEEFIDWKSFNGVGVDAKAFVLTGAQIAGDSAVEKQAPYIVIHMKKTETGTDSNAVPLNQSSCKFRTLWDWSFNSPESNKIGQLQQAYRYRKALIASPNSTYENGFEVVSSKSKIRGRGRALALYMESEPKKECHLLGWNITLNGNQIA